MMSRIDDAMDSHTSRLTYLDIFSELSSNKTRDSTILISRLHFQYCSLVAGNVRKSEAVSAECRKREEEAAEARGSIHMERKRKVGEKDVCVSDLRRSDKVLHKETYHT